MGISILCGKTIAVIGGGPAGLTAAKLLQQAGAAVKVYERDMDADARIKGGTLDLHRDHGQKALEKAGLLQAYYQLSRPKSTRFASRKGRILIENKPDKKDPYKEPEIDRNDLRSLLLGSLEEDTVQWDRKFVSLKPLADRYELYFEKGITEAADIVIGADGGRSRVREYITDSEAAYTGSFLILGEAPLPEQGCPSFKRMCGSGNFAAFSDGCIFYAQTKANGAISYYISFRKPEQWYMDKNINFSDKATVIPFLLDTFSNWHESYRELFLATTEFTGLPMRYMPMETQWGGHRSITLIGDAAHVMPPFAGIGVEIGLQDAINISDNLTAGKFMDIGSAIADYEAKMFKYAFEAQQKTRENERIAHSRFLSAISSCLDVVVSILSPFQKMFKKE